MKERPILFSGPMVRALLAGTKTQTRRIVKGIEECAHGYDAVKYTAGGTIVLAGGATVACPYGAPGERLWVRENGWQRPERTPRMMRDGADTWAPYYYDAQMDAEEHAQLKGWGFKRRPSIHMPRKFCRLVLEVTGVRVERLQSISLGDCEAEGSGHVMPFSAHQMYQQLWISINGVASWNSNPWVWVVEFKRCPATA